MPRPIFPHLLDDLTDPDERDRLERFREVTKQNAGEIYRFKRKLVELRRARGFTQKELAERMCVSLETVRELEHYDSNPGLILVLRYASFVYANLELDAKPSPLFQD